MELVSENSERELKIRRAEAAVRSTLASLATNILRVTRGAGSSPQLGMQAQGFVESLLSYKDAAGFFPSAHFLDASLSIRPNEELMSRCSVESQLHEDAKHQIVRGALQIAASKLCGQLTIERAGDSELHEGVRQLEKLWVENRKLHANSVRAFKRKVSPMGKRNRDPEIKL